MFSFDKIFKPGNEKYVTGLTDELKALYVYNKYVNEKKEILFVVNGLFEANKFYQKLIKYTDKVLFFPMDDFLTSEALAISPELEITRLETIQNLLEDSQKIVVTNLMGFLRYLPEREQFKKNIIKLRVNNEYNQKELIDKLLNMGYEREVIVNKTGEIAIRGFVIDVFILGSDNPIRIEFWGDEVDSIRIFDVETQLTIKNIDEVTILPNTEFLVDDYVEKANRKQKNIINYINPVNILNYFKEPLIIYGDYNSVEQGYKFLIEEITNYNNSLDIPLNTSYMNNFYSYSNIESVYLNNLSVSETQNKILFKTQELDILAVSAKEKNELLNSYLNKNMIVVVCVSSRYRANQLIELLENENLQFTDESNFIEGKINIIVKDISEGFIINDLVVFSEREIFNKRDNNFIYKTNFKMGSKVRDINKLQIGDYVVHYVHGIGRYMGLTTLTKNGLKKDYLQIEYRNNDKIYLPVEKLELISKYSSNSGAVPRLNKLGSNEWEKTKQRVQTKVKNIAFDLLKLYALRESSLGFAFLPDTEEQIDFEKEFHFKETPDQLKVIEEVKRDMESPRPMDRLLCGDVGFGKTEVAFRAIFKAIMSGKQAAFLCPTTILSDQHYKNALERFKLFPINIAILNRFVTKKETDNILKKLKNGEVDLLIGTHRILSEDVEFKDLGLLIIDEEQRFGVTHKEKIKKLKSNIDVLTLTATPIPRTLQMSMSGIRSLSIIETPPVNRYPIQTYVMQENDYIIKDAIYKELSRKGQAFVLYNYVDRIESKMIELQKMIPEARFTFVHGQMTKNELEDKMIKFINHEYDVLVCTTIIETGIDISNANTLIILDADHFGLSQLYQIRGRVGRTNKIAYCYLMYKKHKVLSEIATKRLKAIQEFTELGSGFAIAMRDLSIRGAGDIIGSEQAGFIDSVGIELFLDMLNDEISLLKGIAVRKKEEELELGTSLIDVSTSIDDSYVSDTEIKIEIHQKINKIDTLESLVQVEKEITDRFGSISEDIKVYMYQELFEKLANKLNIKNIRQTKNFIEIRLPKKLTEKLDGTDLFYKVNDISKMFRFSMKNGYMYITLDIVKLEKHFIYYLVELVEILPTTFK